MTIIEHAGADKASVVHSDTYYPVMLLKSEITREELLANFADMRDGVVHYCEKGDRHGAVYVPEPVAE